MANSRNGSRSKRRINHKAIATWLFGSISLVFFIAVVFVDLGERSRGQQQAFQIIASIFCGLFGFFLTGGLKLVADGRLPVIGKATIQAGGGVALFLIVFFSFSPEESREHLPIVGQTNKLGKVTAVDGSKVSVEMGGSTNAVTNNEVGEIQSSDSTVIIRQGGD